MVNFALFSFFHLSLAPPPPFFFPSIASITRLFSSNPFTFQHRSWHFCLLTLSLFAPFSFENFPHLYKLVSGISQLSICILTMNTCLPCLVWIILNHVVLAHNYTWLKRRETIKKKHNIHKIRSVQFQAGVKIWELILNEWKWEISCQCYRKWQSQSLLICAYWISCVWYTERIYL